MQMYVEAEVIKNRMQVNLLKTIYEFFFKKGSDSLESEERKMITDNVTDLSKQLSNNYEKVKHVKYSNNVSDITYTDKYMQTEDSEYFNCINFVCHMFNITAYTGIVPE